MPPGIRLQARIHVSAIEAHDSGMTASISGQFVSIMNGINESLTPGFHAAYPAHGHGFIGLSLTAYRQGSQACIFRGDSEVCT